MAIKIDYVSDIACPWCAVGLGGLEQAINKIGDAFEVEVHFQPFELNPDMPPGGQDVFEHLTQKYGKTVEQVRATQNEIKARAAAVGYPFHPEGRKHVYNTLTRTDSCIGLDLNSDHQRSTDSSVNYW